MAANLGSNVVCKTNYIIIIFYFKTMVSKLGNDNFGDETIDHMKNLGINCDYIFRTDEANSGIANVVVDNSG